MAAKIKVTPICECQWAHITEPHTPPKGDPRYEIDLVFDESNQEMWAWAASHTAAVKADGGKTTGIKQLKDKDKNPVPGRFYVRFKTGQKYPPKVFMQDGTTLPEGVIVGNGSTVRVSYTAKPYDAFADNPAGVTMYLSNVCVHELVEGGSGGQEFGFTPSPVTAPQNEFDTTPTQGEAELPADDAPGGFEFDTSDPSDQEIPF